MACSAWALQSSQCRLTRCRKHLLAVADDNCCVNSDVMARVVLGRRRRKRKLSDLTFDGKAQRLALQQ